MLFLHFLVIKGTIKKKTHVTRKDRKNVPSKITYHYWGDKAHIRPLCDVRNIKNY